MDKQAKEAKQMAKNLPLKEKIGYIWLYYKWWIISVIALVLVIGGTVHEMVTRPKYDLEIAYYTEKSVPEETIVKLEEYFAQFVEDFDGDGNKAVRIYLTSMALGGENPEAQMALQMKFTAELSAGTYPVILSDEYFNEVLLQESYVGVGDKERAFTEVEALAEISGAEEGNNVYWRTRALYENEKKKEERVIQYQNSSKTEKAIFGE